MLLLSPAMRTGDVLCSGADVFVAIPKERLFLIALNKGTGDSEFE